MKFLETQIFDQKWSKKNPQGKTCSWERYFYSFRQTLNKNTAVLIFTKCLGKRANQSLNGLLKFQNLFFSNHMPKKQPNKNSAHSLPRKTCRTASSVRTVRIPYGLYGFCMVVRMYGQGKKIPNFFFQNFAEITTKNVLQKSAIKIATSALENIPFALLKLLK